MRGGGVRGQEAEEAPEYSWRLFRMDRSVGSSGSKSSQFDKRGEEAESLHDVNSLQDASEEPRVTVVIPVKEINGYVMESSSRMKALDYANFEVIILPDRDSGVKAGNARIIASGETGPASKRDIALSHAEGSIIAFLDDDAYPHRSWLRNAVRHFKDPGVAAVGGPAVTPLSDSRLQRASGAVFSSRLVSSRYVYRYVPTTLQEVDDFPSVNFLVRKEVLLKLGGFDTEYWPGEDTKLCLDITKRLKMRIVYDPEALVYHHRRPLFRAHLRQVSRYAFHRGLFARVLPDTSLRPGYFVPAAFLVFIITGPFFSIFSNTALVVFSSVIALYLSLLIASSVSVLSEDKDVLIALMTGPGIFLTHVAYGYYFLRGLLSRKRMRR